MVSKDTPRKFQRSEARRNRNSPESAIRPGNPISSDRVVFLFYGSVSKVRGLQKSEHEKARSAGYHSSHIKSDEYSATKAFGYCRNRAA